MIARSDFDRVISFVSRLANPSSVAASCSCKRVALSALGRAASACLSRCFASLLRFSSSRLASASAASLSAFVLAMCSGVGACEITAHGSRTIESESLLVIIVSIGPRIVTASPVFSAKTTSEPLAENIPTTSIRFADLSASRIEPTTNNPSDRSVCHFATSTFAVIPITFPVCVFQLKLLSESLSIMNSTLSARERSRLKYDVTGIDGLKFSFLASSWKPDFFVELANDEAPSPLESTRELKAPKQLRHAKTGIESAVTAANPTITLTGLIGAETEQVLRCRRKQTSEQNATPQWHGRKLTNRPPQPKHLPCALCAVNGSAMRHLRLAGSFGRESEKGNSFAIVARSHRRGNRLAVTQ